MVAMVMLVICIITLTADMKEKREIILKRDIETAEKKVISRPQHIHSEPISISPLRSFLGGLSCA